MLRGYYDGTVMLRGGTCLKKETAKIMMGAGGLFMPLATGVATYVGDTDKSWQE
jgi:hypothetical protein